jgi:hypothetical protein
MVQDEIFEILNRHVFDGERLALIAAIADNADRFIGIFRSTSPRLKLMQNLLQSREIRFGDALEEIITQLIQSVGFIHLPKRIIVSSGETLSCDQYFVSPDQNDHFLVEQKVRDDHDSTKKRGQVANFRRKLEVLKGRHTSLTGVMYFIDPSLNKNKNYYDTEIQQIGQELGIATHLFYNGDFFRFIDGGNDRLWTVLVNSLEAWRSSVHEDMQLNFDIEPEVTAEELKAIAPTIWLKFIANDGIWSSGVMHTIFPSGESLKLMVDIFRIRATQDVRNRRQLELAAIATQTQIDIHYQK